MDDPLSRADVKRILRVLVVAAAVVSVRGQNRADTIAQADLVAGLKNAERWVTFSGDLHKPAS